MPGERAIFVTVALVLVFASGYTAGAASGADRDRQSDSRTVALFDLAGALDSVEGRPLRMRKITLEPGGVIGIHNHVDRPALTFLLQGQMT